MAEMGPMLKTALRLFGYGGETGGRDRQVDAVVNAASAGQPAPQPQPTMFRAPGAAPGQMTPEQQSDWQAVGLGQMRITDFRAKHGFVPQ